MSLQISLREGRSVITATGDIAIESAEELSHAIEQEIEAGHPVIILDLTGVSFIDSSGISAIVANVPRLKGKSAKLLLAGCNDAIRKVFELVGFQKHFPMLATLEEALKYQV